MTNLETCSSVNRGASRGQSQIFFNHYFEPAPQRISIWSLILAVRLLGFTSRCSAHPPRTVSQQTHSQSGMKLNRRTVFYYFEAVNCRWLASDSEFSENCNTERNPEIPTGALTETVLLVLFSCYNRRRCSIRPHVSPGAESNKLTPVLWMFFKALWGGNDGKA